MCTVETSRHKVLLSQSIEALHQWVLKMFNKLYHINILTMQYDFPNTNLLVKYAQDEPNRLHWCVVVPQWGHAPKTSRPTPGSEAFDAD